MAWYDYTPAGGVINAGRKAKNGDWKGAGGSLVKGMSGPAGYGYEKAYAGPARQKKAGLQTAADGLRRFGTQMSSFWDQRGQTTRNVFDPADRALDRMGTEQPTFVKDLYRQQSGRGPSNQQQLVNTAGAGPSYVQRWAKAYQPSGIGRSTYDARSARGGYSDGYSKERYDSRLSKGPPSRLSSAADRLTTYNGPSLTRSRYETRNNAGPSTFDRYVEERRNRPQAPTNTSMFMQSLGGTSATYLGDEVSGEIRRGTTQGGKLLADIKGGGGQLGGYITDLRGGKGETGKTLADLRAGNTDSSRFARDVSQGATGASRFARDYDPTKTAALGETYSKIRDDGPGYLEKFYEDTASEKNPYFQMLQKDLQDSVRQASAARGGFAAGRSIDAEGRQVARLKAEEFSQRGELAGQAQGARQGRLQGQLGAASAYDQQLLGQQQMKYGALADQDKMLADIYNSGDGRIADLSMGQDRMVGDLLSGREKTAADLAGGQDRMLADLASSGDNTRLGQNRLLADLTGREDDYGFQRDRDMDALQTTRGRFRLDEDAAIDTLAGQDDTREMQRRRDASDIYGRADEGDRAWERDMDASATRAGDERFERQKAFDDLGFKAGESDREDARLGLQGAQGASREEQDYKEYLRNLAAGADNTQIANDANLTRLAEGASGEAQKYLQGLVDSAIRLGDAKAAVMQIYDKLAGQALTDAEIAALQLELDKAGVDQEMIRSLASDLKSAGEMYTKSQTGGAG